VALRGVRELRARLTAIESPKIPREVADQWAHESVALMQRNVRVRTGATKRTIRIQRVSTRGAAVEAGGATKFLEGGTPPHVIEGRGKRLKFEKGGRTIFAKRVHIPRVRPHAYFRKSARAVLRAQKNAAKVIGAWNKAA
jgi:hypothetical protein